MNDEDMQLADESLQTYENMAYGVNFGVSAEYDYRSFSFGVSWARTSSDGNEEVSLSGQAFLDNLDLILPYEDIVRNLTIHRSIPDKP